MSESEGTSSFELGTRIALRQIQIAIGVTMGSSAELLIDPGEGQEVGNVEADLSSLFLSSHRLVRRFSGHLLFQST